MKTVKVKAALAGTLVVLAGLMAAEVFGHKVVALASVAILATLVFRAQLRSAGLEEDVVNRLRRYDAEAEILDILCPKGHSFRFVGKDPHDRETQATCPACGAHTPEYGQWPSTVLVLVGKDGVAFSSAREVEELFLFPREVLRG